MSMCVGLQQQAYITLLIFEVREPLGTAFILNVNKQINNWRQYLSENYCIATFIYVSV